jgi:membrane protease YdiL (CAAX protease family)
VADVGGAADRRPHSSHDADVRGEIATFICWCFGATWALHGLLVLTSEPYSLDSPVVAALYLPGLLAPSVAAFAIEARRRGSEGVRQLAVSGRPSTAPRTRLLVAVAAPLGMTAAALTLSSSGTFLGMEPVLVIGQVWVVVGEEYGWRGWLWPRAVARFGAVLGTVFVTVVWGLWHAPMFAVMSSPQSSYGAFAFAANIAAWGSIHGALQLGARSVFTAMVFHAASNIAVSAVAIEGSVLPAVHLGTAVFALVYLHVRAASMAVDK